MGEGDKKWRATSNETRFMNAKNTINTTNAMNAMNTKNAKVELVAPAGSLSALKSAAGAGADAVYFGIKGLNMRLPADNFDILEMGKIMDLLHKKGKKGYLALNVIIYDHEIGKLGKILAEAAKCKVDAVILWDMAALALAKEYGLKVHISTQASVSNFEALKFYSSLGVERAVLARECTLDDIKEIIGKSKKENVNCKIEAFIHGAMCVSFSGRCFLSHDSFSKSANRGECLQPCRREYKIIDKETDEECEYVLGEDYILSAKDLCTIEFLDKLIESGIDAFKIEGRMRSPEYASVVTSVYREAIDAYYDGSFNEEMKTELLTRLKGAFNRGFTSGFYFGQPNDTGATLETGYEKTYIGKVAKFYKEIGVAEIMVMTGFLKKGDRILISGKNTPAGFADIKEMEIEHKKVEEVGKGEKVGVKLPFVARRNDKVFLWKEKS